MSGEGRDEKKENALKTALDYLDGFLAKQVWISDSFLGLSHTKNFDTQYYKITIKDIVKTVKTF
jgi:hypothetical protein